MIKRIMGIVLLTLIICYAVYLAYAVFISAKSFEVFIAPRITNTYLEVFNDQVKKEIWNDLTYFNAKRLPMATFYTKNRTSRIIILKFLIGNKTSPIVLTRLSGPSKISSGIVYESLSVEDFKVYLTKSPDVPLNHLLLQINGSDCKKICSNDSLVIYRVLFKDAALSYHDINDVFFQIELPKGNTTEANAEIAVLSKKGQQYLILNLPLKNHIENRSKLEDLF